MEVLGVGPTELIFVIIIALIILGPKDMAKAGSTIGKWLNSIIHSDTWKVVRKTSDELRRLPTQLMREDNLEKFLTEDKQHPPTGTNTGTWSGLAGAGGIPPRSDPSVVSKNENIIHPPVTVAGPPVETLKPVTRKPAAKPRTKSTTVKKTEKKPAKKTVTPTRTPRKKPNA
jgi:Sec-independent protein translocase protein TatA